MVKYTKTSTEPASLALEKSKGVNGKYNLPDVVAQLRTDFCDKCYICELKGLTDPEVEHLTPHEGSTHLDLKFDWQNLFWSCRHCNSIKNQKKYTGKIMNCCQIDPENHLICRYQTEDVIEVKALDQDELSIMTAQLIYETFNLKNTGIRIAASQARVDALKTAMLIFFKELHRYQKTKTTQQEKRILSLLRRESAFAGFKRAYIRDHQSHFSNLAAQL